MPDDGFNASTISFGGEPLTPLRDIRSSEAGGKADVTGCADAIKTYEGGVPDVSVTITIVGGTALAKNDKGALVPAWNDASSTGSIVNAMVDSVEQSGSMDSEILSTITFVPTTA